MYLYISSITMGRCTFWGQSWRKGRRMSIEIQNVLPGKNIKWKDRSKMVSKMWYFYVILLIHSHPTMVYSPLAVRLLFHKLIFRYMLCEGNKCALSHRPPPMHRRHSQSTPAPNNTFVQEAINRLHIPTPSLPLSSSQRCNHNPPIHEC